MKKRVLAYLHTHWDREWYRNKEDFNIRFLEVFDIVLDELTSKKAPFFYLDGQVVALLDYLKYREDKKDLIINLIKQKKLAIGPYFVSADSFLVNFCCMLKNLELGINISKEFGQKEYIGYMSDIFGISNSAYVALELNNIDKALIWRGVNPKSIKDNCNFIKNNVKTTWLVQGYFNDFLHSGNISGLENYLDKISKCSPSPLLLPIGADHLGILKNANKVIKEVNKKLKNYEIILSSPFEYFKETEFKNVSKIHEFLDNSDTYILSGVYSARIPQKIRNNAIQTLLTRIVEPLNYFLNDKYSKNIEFIYKTLIKNHAHDGIYGCSVDSVHKAIDSRLDKCFNASNSVLKNIVHNFKIKNNIQGKSTDTIGIFNLSNSKNNIFLVETPYKIKNSQVISIKKAFPDDILYDIYKVPVTEEITKIYTSYVQTESVEPFTYSTVKILKPKKETNISLNTLENKHIKLQIKRKKIYITDKIKDLTVELKLTDIKDSGDSYNFAPEGNYEELKLIKSKIKTNGDILSSLELQFKNIKLIASLNNISKFISFKAVINNKKKNHKLQVNFVLKDKIYKTISDDAIGVSLRNVNPNYNIQEKMPAIRPKELKTNIFPMQNFVSCNDISIMTKGLNEYEIYGNTLKIALLRTFGTISNPKNKARAIPAGPDLECIDSQYLNKKIEVEFSLLFNDYFGVYKNIDLYNEIYTCVYGDILEKQTQYLTKIPKNTFIYGLSKDKKIGYNIVNKNTSLIE